MAKLTTISRVAAPVIAAFTAAEKAQVKVGDAVLAAATKLNEADIKPFCDAIKTSLETKGFTPNSAKVTTMYIRRVLTAVIVDGLEIEPGQTLRGLYDALPKAATGGAKHGARLPNAAAASDETPDEVTVSVTPEQKAERFKAAITDIFGHCDADLIEAMQYVAANETIFVRWAQSSMKAAMLAEVEKAVTPAKRTRKAKQPVEA